MTMLDVACDYCKDPAQLVTGAEIYPHRDDLIDRKYWRCIPCGAYVGCHKEGDWTFVHHEKVMSDGTLPFGRLANAELRAWKQTAHSALDQLWKNGGTMSRKAAYQWAAKALKLNMDQTHIGMFDVDQCKRLVAALKEKK